MRFRTFENSHSQEEVSEDGDILLEEFMSLQEEGQQGDDDCVDASTSTGSDTTSASSTWRFKKNYHSTNNNNNNNDGSDLILKWGSAACALFLYTFRHHRLGLILSIILIGATVQYRYDNWDDWQTKKYKKHISWNVDYSDIRSSQELQLSKINHWCLDGGDNNCHNCHDPTLPHARFDDGDDSDDSHSENSWKEAHDLNVQNWKQATAPYRDSEFGSVMWPVDVIFMGDGNTEARSGTYMGSSKGTGSANLHSHLSKSCHRCK